MVLETPCIEIGRDTSAGHEAAQEIAFSCKSGVGISVISTFVSSLGNSDVVLGF